MPQVCGIAGVRPIPVARPVPITAVFSPVVGVGVGAGAGVVAAVRLVPGGGALLVPRVLPVLPASTDGSDGPVPVSLVPRNLLVRARLYEVLVLHGRVDLTLLAAT